MATMMKPHIPSTVAFTSWLSGRAICDSQGQKIGTLRDFLIEPEGNTLKIRSLVIKDSRGLFAVPANALVGLGNPLPLRETASSYPRTEVAEDDLYLIRDVEDAQLIDTMGVKIIRVNDIQLNWLDGHLVVSGVDIGVWGLARRLGVAPFLSWLSKTFNFKISEGLVPWTSVVPIQKGFHNLRLQVPSQEIKRLHPADLAEIVADLGHSEQQDLLSELTVEEVADVVENSEPHVQVSILQGLDDERAADVLDAMEPDEAADVLGDMPEEEAQTLMTLMTPRKAKTVRHLLTFEEDTAGGMMTTGFIAVDENLTVGEALKWARSLLEETEVVAYFYLIDREQKLSGVVSVRRILLADPKTPMKAIASQQLYVASVQTPAEEVVELIERYNLTALPVVDDKRLVGVVSANDVLDLLLAERRR